MIGRWKRALEEALDRLGGERDPSEDVDRILAAMREELIEAKARVPALESRIRDLEKARAAEKRRAEECVRRAAQAEEIGDTETVEVAERFARRHLDRVEVLEGKAAAARKEVALLREEVREMTRALKDGLARRDTLGIQARRARAIRETAERGRDAAGAFERVAERTERDAHLAEARRELDRELSDRDATPEADLEMLSRADREARAEELLRELKRRMREGGGADEGDAPSD